MPNSHLAVSHHTSLSRVIWAAIIAAHISWVVSSMLLVSVALLSPERSFALTVDELFAVLFWSWPVVMGFVLLVGLPARLMLVSRFGWVRSACAGWALGVIFYAILDGHLITNLPGALLALAISSLYVFSFFLFFKLHETKLVAEPQK